MGFGLACGCTLPSIVFVTLRLRAVDPSEAFRDQTAHSVSVLWSEWRIN